MPNILSNTIAEGFDALLDVSGEAVLINSVQVTALVTREHFTIDQHRHDVVKVWQVGVRRADCPAVKFGDKIEIGSEVRTVFEIKEDPVSFTLWAR
jgi:hypothetical protein